MQGISSGNATKSGWSGQERSVTMAQDYISQLMQYFQLSSEYSEKGINDSYTDVVINMVNGGKGNGVEKNRGYKQDA